MDDSSKTLFVTQVNATLVGLILYLLCLLDVWDVDDSSKTLFVTQVNATLVGLILYLLCWMFRMWMI